VVAPLAGGHHTAIQAKDVVELTPVEGHLVAGGGRRWDAPVNLARFGFAEGHTAAPLLPSRARSRTIGTGFRDQDHAQWTYDRARIEPRQGLRNRPRSSRIC